jgi:hypothetical protein
MKASPVAPCGGKGAATVVARVDVALRRDGVERERAADRLHGRSPRSPLATLRAEVADPPAVWEGRGQQPRRLGTRLRGDGAGGDHRSRRADPGRTQEAPPGHPSRSSSLDGPLPRRQAAMPFLLRQSPMR